MDDLLKTIDRLLHEFEPRSLAIEATVTQSPGADARGQLPEMTVQQTYLATRVGQRYFEEQGRGGSGVGFRRAGYCNGRECTNIGYHARELSRQRDVNISNQFPFEGRTGFLSVPDPWMWSRVGLVPLHECLPTAIHQAQGEQLGRKTEIYRISQPGPEGEPRVWIYQLDQATSVPLQVEVYTHPDRVARGAPDTRWEALSLEPVGGRHVPNRSRMTQWSITKDERGYESIKETLKRETTITSIRFDQAIPSTRFTPKIEPGMRIADSTTKKMKVTPGQRIPLKTSEVPAKTVESTEFPQVVPPSDQSAWLAGVGLGLSLAVLVVAAVLWRRSS